jgi:hypothetical protein
MQIVRVIAVGVDVNGDLSPVLDVRPGVLTSPGGSINELDQSLPFRLDEQRHRVSSAVSTTTARSLRSSAHRHQRSQVIFRLWAELRG